MAESRTTSLANPIQVVLPQWRSRESAEIGVSMTLSNKAIRE